MKSKPYEVATFTAPKPLLRGVRKKARQLHGKRGFSKHVTIVLANDLALKP
jgi:hypothetical protein